MLDEDSIYAIQAESTGVPNEDYAVSVDDVVVLFQEGNASFIQAKKNQPQYGNWAFTDVILQEELCKARDQLESRDHSTVYFYSRSPFGDLQALAEGCQAYPDYPSFIRVAPKTLTDSLSKLANIIKRSEEASFYLVRRMKFGPPLGFEDWDRENLSALDKIVSRAEQAKPILERFLGSHQAKLRDTRFLITRKDIIDELSKHGIMVTPKRSEIEILTAFASASRIGRNWLRTIGNEKIPRSELNQLIEYANQGSRSILLMDRPGSGKTCLLLDFVDYIENSTSWGLLFIKGDQFTEINSETDLTAHGLPDDIIGQCARLSASCKVIVILDSLDVLSLSRRHGALKVFLCLMDRLATIEDLTLVAACRDFDLKYDPQLRARQWQHTITVGPLDFDSVVTPLLRKWNVKPTGLKPELQKLLTLPQNLRLFEKLLQRQTHSFPDTVFELYDRFVDEIITQDQLLGQSTVIALQELAERLIRQRTLSCPKASLSLDEFVLQRLISQEVLVEVNASMVAFSHQTLADSLVVRNAIAHGKNLDDFILSFPPFPFIRPSVRSFVFFLRASQPAIFRRHIRAVLSNAGIAFHLKRLLVESIAEITPTDDDLPLLRWIFQNHPDLFKRLLWTMNSDEWFRILTQYWVEDAKVAADRSGWLLQLVSRLKTWMNRFPNQVVGLWRESLSNQWAQMQSLVWEITFSLDKFEHWETTGIRELLESFLDQTHDQHSALGKPLSKWVQAFDGGDDLLWRYIIKNISLGDTSKWDFGGKLRCHPDEFCTESFLQERLCRSDQFMTLVLYGLEQWGDHERVQLEGRGLRTGFLHETSWRYRHTNHDMHHVDGLTVLLSAIEPALKYRAKHDDSWWRANEPRVRNSRDSAIRYMLVEAYKENLESNIPGLEAQLTDSRLFRFGNIDYELGQLIRAAYPMISAEAQEQNQRMILDLYSDEEWGDEVPPEWIYHEIYNYLIWIPAVFRTQETHDFIDTWQSHFGTMLPSPQIHSSGGTVVAPLSVEEMIALSDDSILKLLSHYSNYTGWHEVIGGKLVGGRDSVAVVLRTISSLDPSRFLNLFISMVDINCYSYFLHAIIDGVGEHLRCRFGNLRKANNWSPVEPLPDGRELALRLLNYVERYPIVWERDWTLNHALQACCYLLNDAESVDRIIILLFRFLKSEDSTLDRADRDSDLPSLSINSTRGVAAENAILLCDELLEKDLQLPELLIFLLRRFARDPAPSVRVSILLRLPYLISKMPDLGWQIFSAIFAEPQDKLWEYAERCFYHNYREHFDRVKPYLNRIQSEAMENAGDVWGRITALAFLSGHLTQERLYSSLPLISVKSWQGIVQVFCANLDRQEHNRICHDGLLTILRQENLPQKVITTIEHDCFGRESNCSHISRELALTFLEVDGRNEGRRDLFHFLDWLGNMARRAPLVALEVAETLAVKLEDRGEQARLWHTEPLVSALVQILREADESDDSELIRRALDLQDRFLRLDIQGMDDLLNQSAKQ